MLIVICDSMHIVKIKFQVNGHVTGLQTKDNFFIHCGPPEDPDLGSFYAPHLDVVRMLNKDSPP